MAAFLAQQAAEKALKAAYIQKHERLWRTHDLVALAQELDAPASVQEACEILTPHYVATRYPMVGRTDYDEEAVEVAIEAAGQVLDWVEGSL